ncbi:hypothetical protein ACPPVO_01650 [Dactylosporangium sp. McL0621]|uniref:hypothetical protein n=1 Tax=Dactylosporangium sp. McL0621 TaxID=3415678 RepID=UPI003CEF4671
MSLVRIDSLAVLLQRWDLDRLTDALRTTTDDRANEARTLIRGHRTTDRTDDAARLVIPLGADMDLDRRRS